MTTTTDISATDNPEISGLGLLEKLGLIGVARADNGIMAGLIAAELEKGELKSCGLAPEGYFGLYGSDSVLLSHIMPQLPDPVPIPALRGDFTDNSGPAPQTQQTIAFDFLNKPQLPGA